jgi:hypothetical protein
MVRRAEITVQPADVNDGLTAQVRGQAGTAFGWEPSGEFLFVLNVRSRNIPATTSAPLILTLGSGAVVTLPQTAVHDGATGWLRRNLPAGSTVGATGDTGAATPTITAKCAKDWPDDFQMRKYCQDKQSEGVSALQRPAVIRSLRRIENPTVA